MINMNFPMPVESILPAMSEAAIKLISDFSNEQKKLIQVPVVTHHLFHAGTYVRTITLKKNHVLTSVLIKRPTVVIVSGNTAVTIGNKICRLVGHHVLAASANRIQAYRTYEETSISMSFATKARSVEEAEKEFTDDFNSLLSHEFENEVIITGE